MTNAWRSLVARGSTWSISPRTLLSTTGSLVGTMVVTSGLGALYWWFAARLFDPASVGIAGAATSAMQVLAVIGVPGIGTLLVRELPRHTGREPALLATALTTTGLVTGLLGLVAAVVLPHVDPDLAAFGAGPLPVLLFAVGVALSGIGLVADLALLGLRRAEVQLVRNVVFSIVKLLALLPAALLIGSDGLVVFGAWVFGAAVSVGLLGAMAIRLGYSLRPRLSLEMMRGLGASAMAHYALNLALQIPVLGMPLIVGIATAAEVTGQFYVAWLVASLAFYVPLALAQTLYSEGSRADGGALAGHARQTVMLSLLAAAAATISLWLLGDPLLGLFGAGYREVAGVLPVLGAASIGLVFKDHFHVIYRIRERTPAAAAACVAGGVAEVVAALVGVTLWGLVGLAWCWFAVLMVEGAAMAPAMVRAAREDPAPDAVQAREPAA